MEILKRVSRFLDKLVFFFTTLAIAGVFYEGMTLQWYDAVGILVGRYVEKEKSKYIQGK